MNDFSYSILAGKSIYHPNETQFRNAIFSDWFELWDSVYRSKDSNFQLTSDEFYRQDLVTVIRDGEKTAALHLYSLFDLASLVDTQTKYFQFFSEEYLEKLKSMDVRTVMSMEFLTVMPDYRKSNLGFSIGSVISQLGTMVFRELKADAIVAPARNDVGVQKMAHDIGFISVEKETVQRGFVCDLIACLQGQQKPSEDPKVRDLAFKLWDERMVHSSAQGLLPEKKKEKLLKVA